MLPGTVDPALAASMISAGFGADQPGRLDDQGAPQFVLAYFQLRTEPVCRQLYGHVAVCTCACCSGIRASVTSSGAHAAQRMASIRSPVVQ